MSFEVNLQLAEQNISRNFGQARFHGNANTKINAELNEERLLEHFRSFSSSHGVGGQVHQLVARLAKGPWKITAAIHRLGLGTEDVAPDPRNHITLSTGHHVRFGGAGDSIIEITGPGITAIGARAAQQVAASSAALVAAASVGGWEPPQGANVFNWLVHSHKLSASQAQWAIREKANPSLPPKKDQTTKWRTIIRRASRPGHNWQLSDESDY